jgi:homoserine O-acetyltransferase
LVGVKEDQLVPRSDMQTLKARLNGRSELIEISSVYGHDAFLKESAVLRSVFERVLESAEQQR